MKKEQFAEKLEVTAELRGQCGRRVEADEDCVDGDGGGKCRGGTKQCPQFGAPT